jgi:hypothetical protein
MIRERALKTVMVLVGLLFLAGIYPVAIEGITLSEDPILWAGFVLLGES